MPSLIKLSKIVTIDKDLLIRLLGNLEEENLSQLDHNLIRMFKLKGFTPKIRD